MILQAPADHYQELVKQGILDRPGWAKAKIAYALEIDDEGQLLQVLPLQTTETRGKKMVQVPRQITLPAPVKRSSGMRANFLWDNAAYLLGSGDSNKPERAQQCFATAKELHLTLLEKTASPMAQAICAFFRTWEPLEARQHPLLQYCLEDLDKGANLTFCLHGSFPDSDPALAACWQRYYEGDATEQTGLMRCLISGELAQPQATHPAIKGVKNAQSSGAALVSFNAPAFCSFGREQNYNAPVSQQAAFAYTAALNYLLADRNHCQQIGDASVVYWSESGEAAYQDFFTAILNGIDGLEDQQITNDDLHSYMKAISQGKSAAWENIPLHPDNRFYVLALSPNAARLSVRFFLQGSFGQMVGNIQQHYDDLFIIRPAYDKFPDLPLWKLLAETVNQNARDKTPSPQMAGDLLRTILNGGSYPVTLYQQTQQRIRAEREITRGRAAIIKACLLRNINNQAYKEALCMELNEETTYQPYVLGRLFSLLETIQEAANPNINTTIKDKYLTSACATPAVVFPTLLNLAEKHLRKLETGSKIYYSRQLGAITGMITQSYPAHHSLQDQGVFQLGYYHQTQKRYQKKSAAQPAKEEN